MANHICERCHKPFPDTQGVVAGYGIFGADGAKVCYACCAIIQRADMIATGKATLYLTHERFGDHKIAQLDNWRDGRVSDWPGELSFPCRVKRGRHNIARWRYDAWFTVDGQSWHGVSYGDNTQIIHCRRVQS